MVREYHKWYSGSLQRDMELLIYGHSGARVLLFPTRTARFFDYEDWRVIDSLRPLIEHGQLQVYALDSVDQESFYCFWAQPEGRIQRHQAYEDYILHEVIPLSHLKNAYAPLISVGCSMGAYHAMNIALRHPQMFSKVVALSGRYDLCQQIGTFPDLLDGYHTDTVYYHMPSRYLPHIPEGNLLNQIRRLQILMVCGDEDAFRENNRALSQTMWSKHIWHSYFEWKGEAHNARAWRAMLPAYLGEMVAACY